MFAFYHVRNVCDAPGQKSGFSFGSETAPAHTQTGAVIPMRRRAITGAVPQPLNSCRARICRSRTDREAVLPARRPRTRSKAAGPHGSRSWYSRHALAMRQATCGEPPAPWPGAPLARKSPWIDERGDVCAWGPGYLRRVFDAGPLPAPRTIFPPSPRR